VSRDLRFVALVRQTEWVQNLLRTSGRVATKSSEVKYTPRNEARFGYFTYADFNGEGVRVTVEVLE
jgi:hypothetical protein